MEHTKSVPTPTSSHASCKRTPILPYSQPYSQPYGHIAYSGVKGAERGGKRKFSATIRQHTSHLLYTYYTYYTYNVRPGKVALAFLVKSFSQSLKVHNCTVRRRGLSKCNLKVWTFCSLLQNILFVFHTNLPYFYYLYFSLCNLACV